MPEPLVVPPDDRAPALRVGGFDITVLASGADTQAFEVFHTVGPPGTGPGPHSHPWDETFFVRSGDVTFGVDDTETVAGPGALVHVPGGARHWYRFGPETGEFVPLTSGHAASSMYRDLAAIDSPDRDRYVEAAARHGQQSRADG
ncbi:MAG: cupin domain-containing protein [Actinomycetota bacterium]